MNRHPLDQRHPLAASDTRYKRSARESFFIVTTKLVTIPDVLWRRASTQARNTNLYAAEFSNFTRNKQRKQVSVKAVVTITTEARTVRERRRRFHVCTASKEASQDSVWMHWKAAIMCALHESLKQRQSLFPTKPCETIFESKANLRLDENIHILPL